jgi:hypothetical protein
MIQRLGLGEDGVDKALLEDFRVRKGIRSKFVDRTALQQNVSHYAQVDRARLGPVERHKFERKVKKIEREVERKNIKRLYKVNYFEERWIGLCLPENPATVYRRRGFQELLAPTVPPHYLERTEKMRWAHETWKSLRPDLAALEQSAFKLRRTRFDIPPAVEAIENMPFLGALAGARALNYSHNSPHVEMLEGYERAFASLEQWITRMGTELSSSPNLVAQIRKVGLDREVLRSLGLVKKNLHAFSDLMNRFEAEATAQLAGKDLTEQIGQLRWNIQTSGSWQTIHTVFETFDPDGRAGSNERERPVGS